MGLIILQYQEFCEPLLHLAGFSVDVLKTDSEGHCRRYVEELTQLPDAILVAGGDGTVSEAVTGLLRRNDRGTCTIGILPVGRTNAVGTKLFFEGAGRNRVDEAKGILNSAISVVRGKTEDIDVMKIEVLPDLGDIPGKPIFALGSIHWGAFRDAFNLRDKYWYTGSLRDYVTFLFNSFSDKLTWNCDAKITYTPPCTGCSNCYKLQETQGVQNNQPKRWWSMFIPKSKPSNQLSTVDYTKIVNLNCTNQFEIEVAPSDLLLSTNNIRKSDDNLDPKLEIQLGSDNPTSFEFLSDSIIQVRTNTFKSNKIIEARTIEIIPKNVYSEENEVFFSIDNEAYEVKPVKVSLIPKAVSIYTL